MKWQKKFLPVCSIFSKSLFLLGLLAACSSSKEIKFDLLQPSYSLPFPKSVPSRVYQGWNSRFTHTKHHAFAIDFLLDKNTPVLAARAGVVSKAIDQFTKGANDPRLVSKANYVLIDHLDGSFAEYFHLAPGSLKVRVGQRVEVDQEIALSGETGFTTVPHLHFMVFKRNFKQEKESIPVFFKTSQGSKTQLKEGEKYSRP